MSPLRTAALVAALLALSACRDLNEGMNLLEGKPPSSPPVADAGPYTAGSPVIAEIIAAEEPAPVLRVAAVIEPEPEPARYVVLDETGPMGEEIATGVDCHPVFRARICR